MREIVALIVASYVRLLTQWFVISKRLRALWRLYVLYFLGAEELEPKVSVNLIVCLGPVKASTFTETLKSEHDTNSLEVP
jgi:hypothetical protein